MARKPSPPNQTYQETHPVLNLFEEMKKREPWPYRSRYRMAMFLRLAMVNGRQCSNKKCRRQDICSRPPLFCLQRLYADVYNWDWGWPGCKRKERFNPAEDDKIWEDNTYHSGTPAEVYQRQLEGRKKYWKAIKMNTGEKK